MEQEAEKVKGARRFRVELYHFDIGAVRAGNYLSTDDDKGAGNQPDTHLRDFLLTCLKRGAHAVRFIPEGQDAPHLKEFLPLVYFGRVRTVLSNRVYPYGMMERGFILYPDRDVVINEENKVVFGEKNLKTILDLPTREMLEALYLKRYGRPPMGARNLGTHATRIHSSSGGRDRTG